MPDFTRARSTKNKEIRLNEIKAATEQLFHEYTYHDISLSLIAKQLDWSRANLYKYVNTKEEIFLAILTDKMNQCFASLTAAFPLGASYSNEVFADVMSGILNCNMDFLIYYGILPMIIETNVSLEHLVAFKKNFVKELNAFTLHFCSYTGFTADEVLDLTYGVFFHASGLCSGCMDNPLARQAAEIAGLPHMDVDFQKSMKPFILMYLEHLQKD